ncbi:MAG: Stp1/IreP family PP2C-type Ser/Thr phosphatase [Acidobacteria bacterium]|nr:MAG: Stp1/IreP family PP2C-type Ser/Thr phosphatase [Acidobacteriota bacterium]
MTDSSRVSASQTWVKTMLPSAALSDPGRKRQINEDYFLVNRRHDLYVLADGMGGHAAGEVASQLVAGTIEEFVLLVNESAEITWPFGYSVRMPYEHNVLQTAVQLANSRVSHTAQQSEQYTGMGATVVVVWIRGTKAFYCHIGDSRIYLLREGQLSRLTQDHSLVQEQISRGLITPEEAKTHRLRHVVTRAVGGRDSVDVSVQEQGLQVGDLLLLCSDGLTDCVTDSEICRIMGTPARPEELCQELVDTANRGGGDDNITVVLVQYSPNGFKE